MYCLLFLPGDKLKPQLNEILNKNSETQCRTDWTECTENKQCCSNHCVHNGNLMCMTVASENHSESQMNVGKKKILRKK